MISQAQLLEAERVHVTACILYFVHAGSPHASARLSSWPGPDAAHVQSGLHSETRGTCTTVNRTHDQGDGLLGTLEADHRAHACRLQADSPRWCAAIKRRVTHSSITTPPNAHRLLLRVQDPEYHHRGRSARFPSCRAPLTTC